MLWFEIPDDCVDDGDCNYNGECINTGATSYPIKQCYCRPGNMGRFCQKRKYWL